MKPEQQARPRANFAANVAAFGALVGALAGCATAPPAASPPPPAPQAQGPQIHPEIWPQAQSGVARDAAIEARVSEILAQMTLEDKVGQVIQADVASVTPEDVRRYRLGSVLNGGSSGPGGDDKALAPVWLDYADRFYDASMQAYEGRVAIPVIWGSDSVHGNANIIGATIFPHNIGLGATRNPDLLRRIGEITAIETRITGQDWTFAPTIAVVRDDRWGRTYEGYSEDPRIVEMFATAIVEGIQGKPGDEDFLRGAHVIATAKHFLGDGGTANGADQGDNVHTEEQLRDIFAPGYPAAVRAGVQSVMASYNTWFGEKMHGFKPLLTDVLVGRFGLDGFVVGDWNGHGQVRGCTVTSCAASINAGLDMFMAPDSWKGLYESTLAQARSGEIPMARLDEAVARILRVKLRSGVFEAGRPSARPYGGQFNLLGSPEHRAVARQAVRESLVLLKNEDQILPLRPRQNVLVVGAGANDMAQQTGGWTISWQGTGNTRADFPNAQTIFEAIDQQVRAAGGRAALSPDGAFTGRRPDVAIVVFGEQPYAEFQGDRPNLDFAPGQRPDLAIIQRLRAQGVPVVAVFISGRAMYVTPEVNASNAFVAAWLPGSEGGGVADVLFRSARNAIQYDFKGQLSYSWPRSPDQTVNVGDATYDPLFPYGYGLTYAAPANLGALPEAAVSSAVVASTDRFFEEGRVSSGWKLFLVGPGGMDDVDAARETAPGGGLSLTRFDRAAQEDALRATWDGSARAALAIGGRALDLTRQANGEVTLMIDYRLETAPAGPVLFGAACGEACRGLVDISSQLRAAPLNQWSSLAVRLSCFGQAGADLSLINAPFVLESANPLTIGVSGVRLAPAVGPQTCPPAP